MILIALGSNLPSRAGSPVQTLGLALQELGLRGAAAKTVSSFYRNPAWPDPADPPFFNAVARLDTALEPAALMSLLHEVELSFGRVRTRQNAPRPLDLDLLDYRGLVQDGPPVLPHPRMTGRDFVLIPLAEIAPRWRHPRDGRDIEELLAALPGSDRKLSKLA